MYGFEEMIDMGLKGTDWTSPDHRIVAVNACICNPNVTTMDDLRNNVKVINSVSQEEIRTVTGEQLVSRGCYI